MKETELKGYKDAGLLKRTLLDDRETTRQQTISKVLEIINNMAMCETCEVFDILIKRIKELRTKK